MKKQEIFFVRIFTVSFLLCAAVLARDYFGKYIEKGQYMEHLSEEELRETEVENLPEKELPETETTEEIPEIEEDETEPETENHKILEFEEAGYEYFDDALFIGDSRTVGIMEYGNIPQATFFADTGLSVFGLEKKKISVPGKGKVSFDEVLGEKQYGKIYLMLGINELGYQFDTIRGKYEETIEKIRMNQKDAIVFLCANLHVTEEQSKKDAIYNNENVDRVNDMISHLADNETTFYIDVNELFDDGNGCLSKEYSSDSFHVLGKYYITWVDWLCTKAIKRN